MFSSLLQKFSMDLLCLHSPVLRPAQGDLVHCSGLELCFSSFVTEEQSTRGHNKPRSPWVKVLFPMCFQALTIKADAGTVPG